MVKHKKRSFAEYATLMPRGHEADVQHSEITADVFQHTRKKKGETSLSFLRRATKKVRKQERKEGLIW